MTLLKKEVRGNTPHFKLFQTSLCRDDFMKEVRDKVTIKWDSAECLTTEIIIHL